MNTFRIALVASVATMIGACSTTPIQTPAPAAPIVANVAGSWSLAVSTQQGVIDGAMSLKQTGKDISGTIDSSMGSVDYSGTLNGNEVRFSYSVEKFGAPAGTNIDYVGTLEGDAMKGALSMSSMNIGEWTAKRK